MKASIITPTFNAARFLEACIRNVDAQGDDVLEHIVVDGGSTDGTIDILRRLMSEFPKVVYVPGPDRGQSDAMNKGSERARGDVIGILNVDDYYTPSAVRRGLQTLAHFTEPAMVVGDCHILDEAGNVTYVNRPRDMRLESLLSDSYLLPIPANPSAYFYTKQVHRIVGGYDVDDHYAMDVEFILSCLETVRVEYVAEHWGNFRLIPGAKTHDDPIGAARVTAVIRRHKDKLTLAQRIKVHRNLRTRQIQRLGGAFLWHLGFLK